MNMANNHAGYEQRLGFIRQLLVDNFELASKDVGDTAITPIQYEPDFPFKYNNFVYRLSLPNNVAGLHSATERYGKLGQSGCVAIPPGTKEFIIRLSNPEAQSMHPKTRVQNEVGILNIASAALSHVTPNVVPRVFGWGGADDKQPGWILQELMPGEPLAEAFSESLTLAEKKSILEQMASLLKALQTYPLPESIRGWGGVTFDGSGAIVSGPMATVGAGPWHSLEDSYRYRLRYALEEADANPHLRGWRDNGVRPRVERFIEQGLPAQLSRLTSKEERSIIHADFTTDNLLYDPKIGRITALLDYDFASILHPGYEFFRSFSTTGGRLIGWPGDATPEDQEALALRNAKLSGELPSPLPVSTTSENRSGVDWELAKAWEVELQKVDAERPSTIPGIGQLADVDEVLGALSPWRLTNEDFLRMNQDPEERKAVRRICEKRLTTLLDYLGF